MSEYPISRYMTRQPWTIRQDATLAEARAMMREHGIRHLPVLDAGRLQGVVSDRDLHLLEALPASGPRPLTVEDAMSEDTYCTTASESVANVVERMADRRRGSVVIVDDHAHVIGIFTTIDAMLALADIVRREPDAVAPPPIPVGISVRHVHLSRAHCDVLFGVGVLLSPRHELSQPHQYVMAERIDLIGPHGELHDVAIINPLRSETQVELARTDAIHLGIVPPLRLSGQLAGTPGLRLRGPCGEVELDHGAILAQRHVHMSPEDARTYGVHDLDIIQVRVTGNREMVLGDVVVRVSPGFTLDLHLDTDEANAAGLDEGGTVSFAGIERHAG
ncbi:MAG: phosphate propanoyltransferase [Kofleriaceae bacterium]